MPTRPTEVLHAALHDHRIRVPGQNDDMGPTFQPGTGALTTIGQSAPEDPTEAARRLALATHALAMRQSDPETSRELLAAGRQRLTDIFRSGVRDPAVGVALATEYLRSGRLAEAERLVDKAIRIAAPADLAFAAALDLKGQIALRHQDNATAMATFKKLTRLRSVSGDWVVLGMTQRNAGQTTEAIESLHRALRLDPMLLLAHQLLAACYETLGDEMSMQQHQRMVKEIGRNDN